MKGRAYLDLGAFIICIFYGSYAGAHIIIAVKDKIRYLGSIILNEIGYTAYKELFRYISILLIFGCNTLKICTLGIIYRNLKHALRAAYYGAYFSSRAYFPYLCIAESRNCYCQQYYQYSSNASQLTVTPLKFKNICIT